MSKINRNTRLTPFQVFVLVVIPSFSSVAFMDMGILSKTAGADGWITSIISAVLAALSVFIIINLGKRFPNDNIFTFSKKIVGNFLGTLINIFYIFYSIIFTVFVLRVYLTIVYNIGFRETPMLFVIILYFLTAAYVSTKNIVIISRIAEVFFLALILIIITIPLLKFQINVDFLLPVGNSGIKNILKGTIPYLNSFLGLYAILLFYPYIENKEKSIKSSIAAILFRTIVFAIYYIMIIGSFGPKRTSMLFWPLLEYMSTISLPFLERIDVILVMIWAEICLVAIYIAFYFSKVGIMETLNLNKDRKNYIVIGIIFALCVYLCQIPKNYYELIVYSKTIVILSFLVNFIIPFILLILSLLLKRREAL